MKFLRICTATLAAACLVCGCATRPIIVGQPRPPISPEAVRVYQVPPRHFERIAILDSPAGTSWIFPDRPSMCADVIAFESLHIGSLTCVAGKQPTCSREWSLGDASDIDGQTRLRRVENGL